VVEFRHPAKTARRSPQVRGTRGRSDTFCAPADDGAAGTIENRCLDRERAPAMGTNPTTEARPALKPCRVMPRIDRHM